MKTRVIAAGILAVAAAACSREAPPKTSTAPPVKVSVQKAVVTPVPDAFEAGGIVRAAESASLSSRIVAPVEQVLVSAGDRVRAGQVLVVLDARQLDAEAQRASAAVEANRQSEQVAKADRDAATAAAGLARKYYERVSSLAGTGSATKQELDEAAAGRDSAVSRAAAADARMREADRAATAAVETQRVAAVARSYARITSPYDGVVSSRSVDPGTLASPGLPLLTVDASRGFRLHVMLDQSRATTLTVGARVNMTVDVVGSVDGTIAEIERTVDPQSHAILVKISLPDDPRLRSGLFGRARIPGATRELVTVPASAVVHQGQLAMVFIADNGVARMRVVRDAPAIDGLVPLVAGVRAGEPVITRPPDGLLDGQPIAVEARQ